MNKKVLLILTIACCMVVLFLSFRLRNNQEPVKQAEPVKTVESVGSVKPVELVGSEKPLLHYKRHVSYGLVLKSNKGAPLAKAELWVYAPANEDPEFMFSTSHPASLERDEMGNRILHFIFADLPPFATKIINVDTELTLQSPPREQPLLNPDLFLAAEPLVQIKNPELIELANQLHHEDSGQTLHNIYDWVSTLKRSSYVARERGALYGLRKKEGDCTEFMQLSLALCRINKIPARGVSGYVISHDSRLSPGDLHDWVEIYLNGAWQLFDPFNRILLENEENYIVMRYHNPEVKGFHRWKTSEPKLKVTMSD